MTISHNTPPLQPGILKDRFGRIVDNIRISVTDRCNFRCRYCMPEEGMVWMDRGLLLTFEELAWLTRILAGLGVRKVRLTGGEPLMRQDLHKLVRMITEVEQLHDIAITTNGFFLEEQARDLIAAGLHRFTVSLDSLDPVKFSAMTRRDYFHRVWKSLDILEELRCNPVKINVVMMRGINDDEIETFAQLARTRPFIVRFIEFMPIGADDHWSINTVVPTKEIITRIEAMGTKLVPLEHVPGQPAERYAFEDGAGEVGFISSVTEPFCGSCNRIRITSDGKLRTCLFSLVETDLRGMIRAGATDQDVAETIVAAVLEKEAGHLINQPGFVRPDRTMSSIGG